MKPHQRKNTRGHPGHSSSETAEEQNLPIFFFLPNNHPNSLFCQWHSSSFTVPRESLQWLRTAHPGHSEPSTPSTNTNPEPAPEYIEFNCAEQFMMFCKALYFHDRISANLILSTTDPALQKKYGRAVSDFTDFLWRQSCERVAFEGNWWKFARDETRRDFLLGTGERLICEAAPMDRRWGIGYTENHALRFRGKWGENLLGKAIMLVRRRVEERLKEREKVKEGDGEMDERVEEDWSLPDSDMWVVDDEGITTARLKSRWED